MSSIMINFRSQKKLDIFRRKLGLTEFDIMILSEYSMKTQ